MSNQTIIWEEEVDINSLFKKGSTPFPDFVHKALNKYYDDCNINEKCPNSNLSEHSTSEFRGKCKLQHQFQYIKRHFDHDGPRVWSDEPSQLLGDEHAGKRS